MDDCLTRSMGAGLILLGMLTACTADESSKHDSPAIVALDVPTESESMSPNLAVGPDGSVVLSWLEADGPDHALKFSALNGSHWGEPGTVSRGADWFINWADFPSVVPVSDTLWAAHWLVSQPEGLYAYDIAVSLSADSGRSWSEPITPHRDGTDTEHGFVSFYPSDDGVGLIWLDGRKMVNEPGEDIVNSGMSLRAASLSPDMVLSNELQVDELICDCCQTDVAITSEGPVAIYRNRTTREIRDIYVSKFAGGGWQDGQPVTNDNWELPGCPVNGPVIGARGNMVAAAWFTAANNSPRVRVGYSEDAAQSFSTPFDVATGETLGRVGLAMLSDGQIAVSWVRKKADESRAVCVRRVSADGHLGPVHVISSGQEVSAFSVPQMVRSGEDLVLAWTNQAGDGNRVRSARISIDSL